MWEVTSSMGFCCYVSFGIECFEEFHDPLANSNELPKFHDRFHDFHDTPMLSDLPVHLSLDHSWPRGVPGVLSGPSGRLVALSSR